MKLTLKKLIGFFFALEKKIVRQINNQPITYRYVVKLNYAFLTLVFHKRKSNLIFRVCKFYYRND